MGRLGWGPGQEWEGRSGHPGTAVYTALQCPTVPAPREAHQSISVEQMLFLKPQGGVAQAMVTFLFFDDESYFDSIL